MPTTPIAALRYPAGSAAPNVPQDIQNLANDVDSKVISRFADATARDAAITSPINGQVCWLDSPGAFYERAAGVWQLRPGLVPHGLLHGVSQQSLTSGVYATILLSSQVRAKGLTTVTATGRIVASIAGVYDVSGMAYFNADSAGRRYASIYKNGTIIAQTENRGDPDTANACPVVTATYPVELAAGDYVQLAAFQDSGGALLVERTKSFVSLRWIGPA